MTSIERQALTELMQRLQTPSAPNAKLLHDPNYIAGHTHAADRAIETLQFILSDSQRNIRKFLTELR